MGFHHSPPTNSPARGEPATAARVDRVQQSLEIVARLRKSQLYPSYESAFRGTTGLPLALRSVGDFLSPLIDARTANPFCRLMASDNKSCSACLCLLQDVEAAANGGTCTLECFAGLSESAVPIRVGDHVVAFLQTGQVFLQPPSPSRFDRCLRRLEKLGAVVDREELAKAYFATRVVAKAQYDSILQLLALMAEHLSGLSAQFMAREATE